MKIGVVAMAKDDESMTKRRLGRLRAAFGVMLLLLAALPSMAQAQFTYTTNNGTITITRYTGTNSEATITNIINGLPVTSIGGEAFRFCINLANVTIPASVTNIGDKAFANCGLTSVTIPNGVTSIGIEMFACCPRLTNAIIGNSVTSIGTGTFTSCPRLANIIIGANVTSIGSCAFADCSMAGITIPGSVTNIGINAFSHCTNLTSVTISDGVAYIGDYAFGYCTNLTRAYFQGNVPNTGADVFTGCSFNIAVYYLPGTANWGATYGDRPTVLWNPQFSGTGFGVQADQFGFTVTATNSFIVVVEACTNLANPDWSPLQTNTLNSDSFYFGDPEWTNHSVRFYNLRMP